MPELPEVETIRRDLAPLLEGRRITRVVETLADPHYRNLMEAAGRTVHQLRRRGKYMIADLGDRELVMHLGMTGQVGVMPQVPASLRHVHVTFELDNGAVFFFNDQRRFGYLMVVARGDYASIPTLAAMGPEPLEPDFAFEPFARAMVRAKTLKPLLLSQRVVAGLGNIYVDEALHRAKLHPERGALTRAEARRLYDAIREVLATGIQNRGTTFKDYRDGMGRYGTNQDFLWAFDQEGKPCRMCGAPIEKTRVGNRGTYLCPHCQRAKR